MRTFGVIFAALACMLGAAGAWAQGCVMAAPMNLEEMVARAPRIVVGECVSVEAVPFTMDGARLTATRVIVNVEEAIRGSDAGRIAIHQFGAPGELANMPDFEPGQRYLLLISGTVPGGLESTIGLDQGAFRFSRDEMGRMVAVNGRGNFGLMEGTSAQADQLVQAAVRRGGEPADQLLAMVRALAGQTP